MNVNFYPKARNSKKRGFLVFGLFFILFSLYFYRIVFKRRGFLWAKKYMNQLRCSGALGALRIADVAK